MTTFFERHMAFTIVGGILAVGLGLLVVVGTLIAPGASGVRPATCVTRSDAESCIRFPSVAGTNLNGEPMTLPEDFAGTQRFVVISFDEEQQTRAQTWLPLARELAAAHDGFRYYNLPTLPDMAPGLRTVISAGLALLVDDPDLRAISVVLYLADLDAFLDALEIESREAIVVLLLDADNEVLWRASGAYDDAQGDDLRRMSRGNFSAEPR